MVRDTPSRPSRRRVLRTGGVVAGLGTVCVAVLTGEVSGSCPEHCPRTPGYWANHFPDGWPEDCSTGDLKDVSICRTRYSVGGNPNLADLREVLLASPRGDKTIIMSKHLISTKLNLHASAGRLFDDPDCREHVRDVVVPGAESWLCDHGGIAGDQRGWAGGEDDKDRLEAFNEGRYCVCESGDG